MHKLLNRDLCLNWLKTMATYTIITLLRINGANDFKATL